MAGRKPLEESIDGQGSLEGVEDPRAAAILALQSANAEAAVAEQEAIAAAAPVLDDKSFRKWDGDAKYQVTGGAFMAAIDGNHVFAEQGVVLGLSEKTAQRGLDFGVLQKL